MKYNVDVVIQALCQLPIPKRDFISPPRFVIVRSFDVNYPGTESQNLKGGVAGGTLVRGVLKLGQTIEIRPGIVTVNADGKFNVTKILSTIVSLRAEQNNIIYAIPGGLIGVGLKIDPFLTKEDTLVGQILGLPGKLPDIFDNIVVRVHLLRRLLGVRQMQGNSVREIKKGEVLLLNVGSTSMSGRALSVGGENEDEITFELNGPVCCEIKEKIAGSRKIGKSYRLIGWGEILSGNSINKES
jgi:translation initiation factor 2 subunit 3